MKKTDNFLDFIFQNYRWQLLGAAGLAIALTFYALKISHPDIQWLEAITGVGTFFMAILIWFNQIRRDWEANLQKRLTVIFQYEGRDLMRCEQAVLIKESDLRAFALHLGAQMGYTKFLKLKPNIASETPKLEFDQQQKRHFKHYHLKFYLTEIPDLKDLDEATAFAFRQRFGARECLVWEPEFLPNNEVSFKIKWTRAPERMSNA